LEARQRGLWRRERRRSARRSTCFLVDEDAPALVVELGKPIEPSPALIGVRKGRLKIVFPGGTIPAMDDSVEQSSDGGARGSL
jgi:hypothetical protein